MARPSKLTPELHSQICALIRGGNWAYVAAEAVGIHRATYYRWLQYGRNARGRGEHNKYRAFLEAVEIAASQGEALMVEQIRKGAAEGDIGAVKWWLMHRFPGRWGLQQMRGEIARAERGPVKIEVEWREDSSSE